MSNGDVTRFRITNPIAQFALGVIQQLGVPAAALAVVLYLVGWKFGPPIVDGHLQVLRVTSKTLEANSETLKQMGTTLEQMADSQNKMAHAQEQLTEAVETLNRGVGEIIDVERQSKQFMERVANEHGTHDKKLDEVLTHVKKD